MAAVDVKVDLTILQRILKNLPIKTADGAHKAADSAADRMKAEMGSSPAPNIDTGTLVGSIQTAQTGLTTWGVYGVDYGLYLEYGTVKMAAHPFVMPAIDNEAPNLADHFKDIANP